MAQIKEKGAKDDTAVSMDFGQVQSALAAGKYEVVLDKDAEAGPEIHGGVWGADPVEVRAEDAKTKTEATKAK